MDAASATLTANGLQDCAAHALGINADFISTDMDRQAMKFSFRNGTNECIIHGPGECSSEASVSGWGYFGVFDGATRQVWKLNSAGANVLFNSVDGVADNADFRETCNAGEIRGLWDRHGQMSWRRDGMLLCAPMKPNELCVQVTDDGLQECLVLGTIPAGLGGTGNGRVYLQEKSAVGITMDEFLDGTTDDNRVVSEQPVWADVVDDIAAVMGDEAVRDLPAEDKLQVFNKIPAVQEAREEAKEIVNTRKVVTTVSYPKVCVGSSEFCTVINAPL
jgi:hypothetical protein